MLRALSHLASPCVHGERSAMWPRASNFALGLRGYLARWRALARRHASNASAGDAPYGRPRERVAISDDVALPSGLRCSLWSIDIDGPRRHAGLVFRRNDRLLSRAAAIGDEMPASVVVDTPSFMLSPFPPDSMNWKLEQDVHSMNCIYESHLRFRTNVHFPPDSMNCIYELVLPA